MPLTEQPFSLKNLPNSGKAAFGPSCTTISVPNQLLLLKVCQIFLSWVSEAAWSSTGHWEFHPGSQTSPAPRLNEMGQPCHREEMQLIKSISRQKKGFSLVLEWLGHGSVSWKPLQSRSQLLRAEIEDLAAELPRSEEILVPQHISELEVSQPGLWSTSN